MNPQEIEIAKQITEKQRLYQRVFSTSDGKEVLEDLAKRCFELTTTFDDNTHRMAFNEGRRSIYKFLIQQINRDIKSMVEQLTSPSVQDEPLV